jgi:site-specific recombinase XerD
MPTRTGYSSNTVESYRDAFIIFLRYCSDELKIKPEKIDFSLINRNMIEEYLVWIENKKKWASFICPQK